MNILTIDTSTDFELISVTTGGKTFEFAENVRLSHSVTMFDSIGNILHDASLNIRDIDLIGTGIGPGSFTGVRIAVTTSRMIAQILNVPIVGLVTQDIFASSVKTEGNEKILAAFDAKKSRVFASLYNGNAGIPPDRIIPAGDYTMDYMLGQLGKGDRLVCIGDGCGKYLDLIDGRSVSEGFSYRFIEDFVPSGEITSKLTLAEYIKSPDMYRTYTDTVPFYARKSDAEVAKDEKIRMNQ